MLDLPFGLPVQPLVFPRLCILFLPYIFLQSTCEIRQCEVLVAVGERKSLAWLYFKFCIKNMCSSVSVHFLPTVNGLFLISVFVTLCQNKGSSRCQWGMSFALEGPCIQDLFSTLNTLGNFC